MFLSQRGSSILQALLAFGVISVGSYFLLNTTQTANKLQVKEIYNQDLSQITAQIQSILGRTENCWITINRSPITGISLGEPINPKNYYQGFKEKSMVYKVGEQIGNSGIMITSLEVSSEGGRDYLDARFRAKEGVKLSGGSDALVRFKIKYTSDIQGLRNSCFSEEGDVVAETTLQACLNLSGFVLGGKDKCNIPLPQCTFSTVPCGASVWRNETSDLYLEEVGTNPGYEPLNSFADANYTYFPVYKCCAEQIPFN